MKYKYIILVRHGEPDNPKNIVYSLDEIMNKKDMIHITDYGKLQLKALGKVIIRQGYKVVKVRYSNQIRAVESVKALNKILRINDIKPDLRLRDGYAPGPYIEKFTMDQWKKGENNIFDIRRWGQYNHEKPESIINRFNDIYEETIKNLDIGNTAILLSHGDLIALWINYKIQGKLPNLTKLKSLIYLRQGEAFVIKLNNENKTVKQYLLEDQELLKGKIY
jgi:broad specificity phosphatase PhoE